MSGDVAIAERSEVTAPVQGGESAALISMIERAARDPNVDIDKMERLFQMHERIDRQRAKSAYLAALAAMQPELPVVEKNGSISRTAKDDSGVKKAAKSTKYAKWEDVVEAIAPVLAKHGFSLSFRIKQEARVEVTGVLGHRDGHSEETSMSLPIDDSGAKNNLQGWGSSVSYGKRYTAFALLNIVARGEDNDGNGADDKPTDAKLEDIFKLIDDTKSDRTWFLEKYSVESFDDLNGKQRNEIKSGLTAKLAHMRRTHANR
jgi:hypothetical protein